MPAVSAFMQAEHQERSDAEYLRHWYFRNPIAGSAMLIGEREGSVVGMATMNVHHFRGPAGLALAAMPQKVLTHASLRGQGIFGRLYRACETVCLARGVDFFITVTNAASTPIFLAKFGYQRAPSPTLGLMLPMPGRAEAGPLSPAASLEPVF